MFFQLLGNQSIRIGQKDKQQYLLPNEIHNSEALGIADEQMDDLIEDDLIEEVDPPKEAKPKKASRRNPRKTPPKKTSSEGDNDE